MASAERTKADAEAKLKEVKDTYNGKSGDYPPKSGPRT